MITSAGLNSLRQKKVQDISQILDFGWFIPQNGDRIGHLGAMDDPTLRTRKFFGKIGVIEVAEAGEVKEATFWCFDEFCFLI